MSTVARRVGVGVATLYRRFPTRSALPAAAFDDQLTECATVFEEALADPNPGHGLYVLLETACTTLVTDRGFDTVFMTGFPEVLDYDRERACVGVGLNHLVQRARDAGQLREDFDTADISLFLLAVSGLARQHPETALPAARRPPPAASSPISSSPSRPTPHHPRVKEISELARSAEREGKLSLAAAAQNKAALIACDCGMPDLAHTLCWRHAEVYLCAQPLSAQEARHALEPVVNIARLLIRDGDGNGAYHLLDGLVQAARARGRAEVDGHTISFNDLTATDEEHHQLYQWLWTVLLGDGTRALVAAEAWDRARSHARRHRGAGQRLLDGRQVEVLGRRDHHSNDGEELPQLGHGCRTGPVPYPPRTDCSRPHRA
ncbi:TetR/AcrR family transcriptional regulator [Streptomyces asiaticus]